MSMSRSSLTISLVESTAEQTEHTFFSKSFLASLLQKTWQQFVIIALSLTVSQHMLHSKLFPSILLCFSFFGLLQRKHLLETFPKQFSSSLIRHFQRMEEYEVKIKNKMQERGNKRFKRHHEQYKSPLMKFALSLGKDELDLVRILRNKIKTRK